jgi:hypothetical protein
LILLQWHSSLWRRHSIRSFLTCYVNVYSFHLFFIVNWIRTWNSNLSLLTSCSILILIYIMCSTNYFLLFYLPLWRQLLLVWKWTSISNWLCFIQLFKILLLLNVLILLLMEYNPNVFVNYVVKFFFKLFKIKGCFYFLWFIFFL